MKYAYYPGCSLEGTAKEYDISARSVCRELGVELQEIPDWSCCGASSAHVTNHMLAYALPARNLALAEAMGLDVTTPCAACFNRLTTTAWRLAHDELLRRRVNGVIDMEYRGSVKVKPLLQVVVEDLGHDAISRRVRKPLSGLKVAAYYGCLLVRPPEVTRFDDPENPQVMDRLIQTLGGEAVEWPFKTECCGMSLSVTRTDIAVKLINDILAMAKASGAECVVTACPMCQANLDMRQAEAEARYGAKYQMPVYYFTQLLGLAMGLAPRSLGLYTHMVDTINLLKAKKLA